MPSRTFLSEPQKAEQLVEVSTVVSFVPRQSVKQTVDIPVRARGLSGNGSPQEDRVLLRPPSRPPTFQFQIVVVSEVFKVLPQDMVCSDLWNRPLTFPVPHTRRLRGGFHGPRQWTVEQNVGILIPFGGRPLHGFHTGQSSTPFTEQLVDTGDLRLFHPRQGSSQRSAAQNVDIPVLQSRARGWAAVSRRRVDDDELEARLEADCAELSAIGYSRLSLRQMDRLDEILQELNAFFGRKG